MNPYQTNCLQAFAVASHLEALIFKTSGLPCNVSEQMQLDCNKLNGGCEGKLSGSNVNSLLSELSTGGWPTESFYHIQKNGVCGQQYEYKNTQQKFCLMRKYKRVMNPKRIRKIHEINFELVKDKAERHELMKRIINHYGSVVGAICISPELMAYSKGVYLNDQCCTEVNHAIVRASKISSFDFT